MNDIQNLIKIFPARLKREEGNYDLNSVNRKTEKSRLVWGAIGIEKPHEFSQLKDLWCFNINQELDYCSRFSLRRSAIMARRKSQRRFGSRRVENARIGGLGKDRVGPQTIETDGRTRQQVQIPGESQRQERKSNRTLGVGCFSFGSTAVELQTLMIKNKKTGWFPARFLFFG